MRSLTVRLPERLVAEIEVESRGRGCSKSDIIRERSQGAERSNLITPSCWKAFSDLIGSVDGVPNDLSARKKLYLKTTGYGRSVIVDAGFLVALLSRRDSHHEWAILQAPRYAPPWRTCDAVVSEAIHLVGAQGVPAIGALLRRHADVPMSLADACLVRMAETLPDPLVLTTDADFRIYRRHGRQVVPCVTPR